MDQASASPAASYARNPAALRTSSSCSQSADRAQTAAPPLARSSPQSEPHSEPVRIAPRPSSPTLCQSNAKGYLLPDFYSGCATGISGRFTEGLLLRRSHRNLTTFGAVFGTCARRRGRCFNRGRLARLATQSSDGIEQFQPVPNCCDPKLLQGLVRQARQNRLVYFIVAESRLVLPETEAPKPDHDVHEYAHSRGGEHLGTARRGCPAKK